MVALIAYHTINSVYWLQHVSYSYHNPHFFCTIYFRITRKEMDEEEKKRKKAEEIKKRLEDMERIKVEMEAEMKQERRQLHGACPRLGKARKMEASPEEEDPSEIIVLDTGMFSVKVCHLTSTEYRLIVLRLYAQC